MKKSFWRQHLILLLATGLALSCAPQILSAKSVFTDDQTELRYLGLQVGFAGLSGGHTTQLTLPDQANGTQYLVPSKNFFKSPVSFALAFGLRPERSNILAFGELAYLKMSLKDQVTVPSYGDLAVTGDDVSMYLVKGGLAIAFNNFTHSRFVTYVGAFGELGARHFNVSGNSGSVLAAGPTAALDIRLTGLDASGFFVLHTAVEYAGSFTDGWPDMVTFNTGFRFYWR